jgi:hypothetical protein
LGTGFEAAATNAEMAWWVSSRASIEEVRVFHASVDAVS